MYSGLVVATFMMDSKPWMAMSSGNLPLPCELLSKYAFAFSMSGVGFIRQACINRKHTWLSTFIFFSALETLPFSSSLRYSSKYLMASSSLERSPPLPSVPMACL